MRQPGGSEAFARWSPPADETFHQLVGRLDARGGYAVEETNSSDDLGKATARFGAGLDFGTVAMAGITDRVSVFDEGADFPSAH